MSEIKSFSIDESTAERIEELREALKSAMPGLKAREYSDSAMVRNAIAFHHRYVVGRESMIHPTDPRFER